MTALRPLVVLVTAVGSTTGLSVIKALRKQTRFAARVVGTDLHEATAIAGSAFCDEFVQVPPATHGGYIGALLKICGQHGVQMLVPIVDGEVEAVADHRDEFAAIGTKVAAADPAVVRICNDKYLTFQALRRIGAPVAETWLPDALPAELRFPLIVKPAHGISSVGVQRADDRAALARAVASLTRPVVQEYLDGPEFTIDVVADDEARALAIVPRERLETKGGISSKGRTIHDSRLIELARSVVESLGIAGPSNLQCRITSAGPAFFEINPRFSGSLPLTVEAGVNGPEILAALALGEPVADSYPFRAGVTMTRYWEEIFRDA